MAELDYQLSKCCFAAQIAKMVDYRLTAVPNGPRVRRDAQPDRRVAKLGAAVKSTTGVQGGGKVTTEIELTIFMRAFMNRVMGGDRFVLASTRISLLSLRGD